MTTEPTTGIPAREPTFVSLQCLRGLAATLVLIGHLPGGIPHSINGAIRGGLGVDLFFIISGFVMAHTLSYHRQGVEGAVGFFLRRALRIYPLYFLATLLSAVWISGFDIDWGYLLRSVSCVPLSSNGKYLGPMLFLGWTLSFEMFFYVVLTALIAFRRASWQTVLAVFLPVVIAGQIWPPQSVWFSFVSAPIIVEFAAGLLCYKIWQRHRGWIESIRGWLLGVGSVLFLVALKGFDGNPHGQIPRMIVTFWGHAPMWRPLAWGIPSFVFFMGVLAYEPALRTRRIPLFKALGDASYSLYLFHEMMMALLLPLIGVAHFAVTFIYLPITMAASILLFHLIEQPMMIFFKRILRRRGAD